MKDNILTTIIIALIVIRVIDFSHLTILDIIIIVLFFIDIVLKLFKGGRHESKKNPH